MGNKQPNILIFMTDHQRGDTVLPEHPVVKPNLDAFTKQAVAFTNAYCPSPHCCPARATFMTGLYPSRHGVWNNVCNDQALSRGLKKGVRTWSEDLAKAGYNLLWSGKWHVSVEEGPKDRGWTELLVSGNKPQEHGPSWEHFRTVSQAPDPERRGEGQILRPGWGHYTLYGTAPQGNKHDEKVLGEALAALPRAAAGKQPWAMFVGMIGPHDPYMVPRKFLDLYDLKDIPLPESYADDLSDKPRVYKRIRDTRFGQLTDREVREAIRHFRAYCSYLDHLFGELLAALDKTGQAQDTLVLYCSDHGDYCGEHGLFAKGIPCFRGAYHVPAIIRWPAGVDCPGRRVDSLVSLADFAPTFVEAAGGKVDPQLTGQSLVPFLTGPSAPIGWREEIHTQCNGVELYYTQRSVMTKDFKYVYNGFDNDELYALCRDEHEMTNLAGDANFDLIKRDLIRRMWRFARQEQDAAINSYITVGLAPFGPGEAFKEA